MTSDDSQIDLAERTLMIAEQYAAIFIQLFDAFLDLLNGIVINRFIPVISYGMSRDDRFLFCRVKPLFSLLYKSLFHHT